MSKRDDFDAIVAEVLAKHEELLRRLAKWDTKTSPAPAVGSGSSESIPTRRNASGCGS